MFLKGKKRVTLTFTTGLITDMFSEMEFCLNDIFAPAVIGFPGNLLPIVMSELKLLLKYCSDPQLIDIKKWLTDAQTKEVCRKRAQSARAFGSWCEKVGLEDFGFWKQIPVQKIEIKPQCTVVEADYKKALSKCTTTRDTALVEMLWSTGMRREELARACIEHVDFVSGYIMVPSSKNGRPRIVSLSPKARQTLRRLVG